MVKNIAKILVITIILFMFSSIYTFTYASDISSTLQGADDLIQDGKENANNVINFEVLNDTSDFVYNFLLIIGICAAVIVATILGIQFITGSVEQKVKVKETLIPFVIGCVVLFGAFGIWRLVIVLLR